jgi:hypothetical protein
LVGVYNLKILFVDNLYSAVLDNLSHFSTPAEFENHFQLNESLNSQKFAAASMLSLEINNLGHESKVIFSNAMKSQLAWLRESGIQLTKYSAFPWRWWQLISRIPMLGINLYNRTTLVKILIEQIREYKPDYVYCVNINILNSKLIKEIKHNGSSVIGQIASPLPPKQFYKTYDHIFSAHPGQVVTFKSSGVSSSWLPLAFDRTHFDSISQSGWPKRSRDVSFVGTFGRHQKNTGPLMKAIAQEIPSLEIFTFAKPNRMKRMGLENNHRGPAWGPEMHKVIAESKIVINRHGKVADGFAVNYRLFEGTGMGALVVTEQAKNMTDLFEPDQEIITYSSIEDAVKKIKIALENPEATARIAKRGQTRTLETHTFANRAKQVLETLSQLDK